VAKHAATRNQSLSNPSSFTNLPKSPTLRWTSPERVPGSRSSALQSYRITYRRHQFRISAWWSCILIDTSPEACPLVLATFLVSDIAQLDLIRSRWLHASNRSSSGDHAWELKSFFPSGIDPKALTILILQNLNTFTASGTTVPSSSSIANLRVFCRFTKTHGLRRDQIELTANSIH
jgi:hypothetical protein